MGNRRTQFTDLPLEMRELVWEATLPPPRLFHVKRTVRVRRARLSPASQAAYDDWFPAVQGDAEDAAQLRPPSSSCFKFYKHHQPPIITRVCRESRRHAIRAGYFVLPTLRGDDEDCISATWFGPSADILYYPANYAAENLAHFAEIPYFHIPNLPRVRVVGVEARYLLNGLESPSEQWTTSEAAMDILQDRILAVYAHMPLVRNLYFILPAIRHQAPGRSAFRLVYGQEPSGFGELNAELAPLPLSAMVPCHAEDKTWAEVLRALQNALGTRDMRQRWLALFDRGVCFPPEIDGHRLMRIGRDGLPVELPLRGTETPT